MQLLTMHVIHWTARRYAARSTRKLRTRLLNLKVHKKAFSNKDTKGEFHTTLYSVFITQIEHLIAKAAIPE